ncbi:MAG: 2-C-methyl-D-erythritol 2,4-cyclodiphosphate synthase [Peptostreptococcaceae bacterium]|nr:2-C-methyl-D-erythritol 2,4-cyclodiphosphate synthase [Peptostreptococcaceae bacterium]
MRIGIGYDVHALTRGRKLMLGGVEVPHEKGLIGHSDADVLLHAIIDALLGAAALGDIGGLFPDHSEEYRDIDSRILLERTGEKIRKEGFCILNIDSSLIAQRPRLAPHIRRMREEIARVLGLELSQVSVKATTTEKLGFEGREEGISAQAVVLLRES